MMNIDYIINGIVNRGNIVSNVCSRNLNRADIEELCSHPEVQEVFIGESYPDKITDKNKWNQNYLDKLNGSYNVCFNRDYLLHMCDVAEYVASVKKKAQKTRRILAVFFAFLIIAIGVIVGICMQSYK